ncbi:signal peptidase complex subunit 1 [Patagioenas fasciata]
MAAQGNDSAEAVEAEAEAVEAEAVEAEARSSGEPLTVAVNQHHWPWGDGAEQDWRVSGQLSRLLPLLLEAQALLGQPLYLPRGAFATAAPSDANSRQSPPGSDGEDTDSSEDSEEPRSAAMLNIFRSIPTQMDYKGQKLAEQIFQGIILVSAIIGFIYGYITEQFGWTVYIVMAGFLLSCLLTLPPWPMYRRNPLQWLPVQESGAEEKKSADRKPKRHAKS